MICHAYYEVHKRRRGVCLPSSAAPRDDAFPEGSLSPAQILIALGFTEGMYAGVPEPLYGIGSLGGGVVQADIDASAAAWSGVGFVAPEIDVLTVGGATNNPSDTDSNVENMLDLVPTLGFTVPFLTKKAAKIKFCIGPNASGGMGLVTQAIIDQMVDVMSWSWGGPESSWASAERSGLDATFQKGLQQGVVFCAASGDNSIDDGTSSPVADYPAASAFVCGVGGTFLTINPDGSRASESAWGDGRPGDAGGGGGFDQATPLPAFQQGIVASPLRGVPDCSANADPNSGWQGSFNGSWSVVGGTSAASPFVAALLGIAKAVAAQRMNTSVAAVSKATAGQVLAVLYACQKTAFNDITTGSDGKPATPGWDPATGLGSPRGPAFVEALATAFVNIMKGSAGATSGAPSAPSTTGNPLAPPPPEDTLFVDTQPTQLPDEDDGTPGRKVYAWAGWHDGTQFHAYEPAAYLTVNGQQTTGFDQWPTGLTPGHMYELQGGAPFNVGKDLGPGTRVV